MILGRSKAEVCGFLLFVWEFANRELGAVTDRVDFVTEADIDGESCPGFAAAMVEAGWLKIGPGWVEFIGYNDPDSYGSWKKHQAQKAEKLSAANSARAAAQARKEQIHANLLGDLVTKPVTNLDTSPVTNPVTNTNGNGNVNKEIQPPFIPPAGETKNDLFAQESEEPDFSHGQSVNSWRASPAGRREFQRKRRQALEEIAQAAPDLAGPWVAWLNHCAEIGKLPSQAQAEADFSRLAALGSRAGDFLAQAIQRRRYTLEFDPRGFGPSRSDRPPRQEGQKRMEFLAEKNLWVGCSCLDREIQWDPEKKRWMETGKAWGA